MLISNGVRPHRDLAPDLAQADDAERRAAQRPQARNASVIRSADIAAVIGADGIAGRAQLLGGHDVVEFDDALGERDQEREHLFGDRNIDDAAQREDGDPPLLAGLDIDAGERRAETLHGAQAVSPARARRG